MRHKMIGSIHVVTASVLLALVLLGGACTPEAPTILEATSLDEAQFIAAERSGVIVVEFWKHN